MSALREELQSLRMMQLHARAEAAGVDGALLEGAMDGGGEVVLEQREHFGQRNPVEISSKCIVTTIELRQ